MMGRKVPTGFLAVLQNTKVWAAVAAAASIWSGVFFAPSNVTPEKKQELIQAAIWATSGVASAVIIALGYEGGKSVEGTVPEGYESALKVVAPPPGSVLAPLQPGESRTVTTSSAATPQDVFNEKL
jgi:hypothetical protein